MTFERMIENILSIDETIRVHFKRLDCKWVLIFWRGHSPIAHVYAEAFDYSLDYPKLFEMHYRDVLQIDAWLADYVETEIENRKIPF